MSSPISPTTLSAKPVVGPIAIPAGNSVPLGTTQRGGWWDRVVPPTERAAIKAGLAQLLTYALVTVAVLALTDFFRSLLEMYSPTAKHLVVGKLAFASVTSVIAVLVAYQLHTNVIGAPVA